MRKEDNEIRIVGVEARDFRRLSFARIELDGRAGLVRVTGKNRQGKTSLLHAIAATLGGARHVVEPAMRAGAEDDESFTRVLLSNGFTVERRYSSANPKGVLTVKSREGGKFGQTKLDEWLGSRAFDPLAFFELSDPKRTELLLSLSPDEDLPERVAEIRFRRKEAFEERTHWIRQQRAARTVEPPEGERPEPVDVQEVQARLYEISTAQARRAAYLRDAERADTAAERERDVIADLLKRLAEAEARLEGFEIEAAGARELAGKIEDHAEEIEALNMKIADAQAIDEQLAPWREYDRSLEREAEATERVSALTAVVEGCDSELAELLAVSGIPVPGLSFDAEGTPLINGRPFSDASGAERITVAVAVALAVKPDLRLCLLDEANDCDLDMLVELHRLAQDHGFQVWAVRIGLEGAGEVVVHDGEALTFRPEEVSA
jgi:hypothetical protein